jgi:hypothetical protein
MKKVLLIVLSLIFISFAEAQNYSQPSLPSLVPGLEEQINLNVSPENPGPNQEVSISLEAFGTDLNRADISWLINGAVQKNGVGATQFSFVTGKSGSVSDVVIYILPVNGTKITKEILITPASVDIVWESPSYVPPFYKSKRLYPPEGSLTFVALPNLVQNGTPIDPKTLVYKWTINQQVVADRSGYGKNTISVTGDVLNQGWNINVEVSSVKDNVVGDGSVSVSSIQPQLLLYEHSPTYGFLFNQELPNQYQLKNSEVTVAALPYYFSILSPNDPVMKYNWSMNNQATTLLANQNSVTFRKPDNIDGQSLVLVNAANQVNFLQSAAANMMISFYKNSNAPISF